MSWLDDTTMPRARRAGGPSPVATLELLFSPRADAAAGPIRRVLVPGRALVVGRQPGEGLQLLDERASRRHATFTLAKDEPEVEVLDTSANGTFVDGVAIEGAASVQDGAVVRMGDSFALVRFVPPDDDEAAIEGLRGRAPGVRALRRLVRLVAPTDATVLVLGETGTGKELVARALHARSGRAGPFVAVNCAAIPEPLAEAQLFGHVAGAFTGAKAPGEGFFRAAEGGTLLLDEVGELPATLQPKLLRAIEERAVVPVGATAPIPCDLRLVAATHRALAASVEEGGFRGDLYARLAEIVIETPPLRARREDVLPLLCEAIGRDASALDPELVEALLLHPWPFNVRELLKVAKELAIRGAGAARLERALIEARLSRPDPAPAAPSEPPAPPSERSPPTREELERWLTEHRGNLSRVSRESGWSRRQLARLLAEHGLDAAGYRS